MRSRVHRRADLVAHGRQEGALGLVGRLGSGAGFLRLLNIFPFWIAITAWSAKVLISAISLSLKGLIGRRAREASDALPFQTSGTTTASGHQPGGALAHQRRHIRAVEDVGIVQHDAVVRRSSRASSRSAAPGRCDAANRRPRVHRVVGEARRLLTFRCTRPSSPIRPMLTSWCSGSVARCPGCARTPAPYRTPSCRSPSALRRWPSAARAPPCVSLNRRTFSMAISAWSRKDSARAISLSLNAPGSRLVKLSRPTDSSSRQHRQQQRGLDAEPLAISRWNSESRSPTSPAGAASSSRPSPATGS